MRQLLQSVRKGTLSVSEVPLPRTGQGQVLIQVAASLVSVGTERMVVDFAEKNLLQKAKARPDLVRQVLDKARREGILTTLESVRNRLDQPLALGYSCSGSIIAVSADVHEFHIGERVACAGGGYAVHAEVISVPKNLIVKLPENVGFEAAAFTTLGAIALQGVRLAEVRLGEVVTVIGLGLVGQLAVQLLKAAGCLVIGLDLRPERADLATQLGADAAVTSPEHLSAICDQISAGHGADAVIITADTESNQPVELAGQIARHKGIVVAVGAVGMNIPRKIYYEKELDFRISRSYGPGRYDPEYEEKGHDYPYAYVRWTEQRNMQAFAQLLADGKVNVQPLITHRFPIEEAAKAYELITGKTGALFLGVLLTYPDQPDLSRRIEFHPAIPVPGSDAQTSNILVSRNVAIGLLGAGNFATATLLPAMKKVPAVQPIGVCAATGLSARHVAEKFGFSFCSTDENDIFNDPRINTVVIATRHHLHARQVLAGLNAGKHIFCEKPLAISEGELSSVVATFNIQRSTVLTVGYNRRFAPMAIRLKKFLADVHEPLIMHYRVNAGYVPPDHWVQDPDEGGGRIIGEMCHFVDFLIFLANALPVRVQAQALPNNGRYQDDNVIVTLEFENGTLGTITYAANGDRAFSKERVEVFGGETVAVLDDFRCLELVRHGRRKVRRSLLRQDKGHRGEWEALVSAVQNGGPSPISFTDLVTTTLTTFHIREALCTGEPVKIGAEAFIASALAKNETLEAPGESIKQQKFTL